MNDKLFKRFVINYKVNIISLLNQIGTEVRPNSLFFCPMHENYNTPAAKLFEDNHFFCFAEQRQYGAYDVLEKVMGYNMEMFFKYVWDQCTPDEKEHMQDMFGDFDENKPVENLDVYQAFRYMRIDYKTMIAELERRELMM